MLKLSEVDFEGFQKNFEVGPKAEIVLDDRLELALAEAVRVPGIDHMESNNGISDIMRCDT